MSFHPVNSDEEIDYILDAVEELAKNHEQWSKEYLYNPQHNNFLHSNSLNYEEEKVKSWFE
jgi:hypothetical protein